MSDVAKLAGVGTMTVSRVLNGNANVSDEMRRRVLRAIAELSYVPNEVARSLREQRGRQIGVIVPDIRDSFFAICSHAISRVAKTHEYSVVLTTSEEDPETEFTEAVRLLRRRIDGLIIVPASEGGTRLTDPEFRNTPIVTLDRPVENTAFDCVLVQNRRGAQIGTQHLIEHGHTRIVHLCLSRQLYTMRRRVEGYRAAMKAAGLTPEIRVVNASQDNMLEVMRSLMASRQPPSALFCGNNVLTCNALHALSAMEIRVPEKVAVVGFDDFETADILKPAMTVVRQPIDELGRLAAEILFKRLGEEDTSPPRKAQRLTLPVELIVRNSCGAHAEVAARSRSGKGL